MCVCVVKAEMDEKKSSRNVRLLKYLLYFAFSSLILASGYNNSLGNEDIMKKTNYFAFYVYIHL